MELNVCIKEEMDEEMPAVKEETMDDTATHVNASNYQEAAFQLNFKLDQPVKEEILPENAFLAVLATRPVSPLFALKAETCHCPGEHCEGCLVAEVSKELPENDSSLVSGSGDDSDNMPSDWFSGASSDSEEATADASVAVTAASVYNDPIKEEHAEESLSTFASTQPSSPSIVVKDETCLCTEDCHDCLETEQSDSDEAIVDAPLNVPTGPVSNSCATTSSRSFPCPECGKIFPSNSNLIRHLRVHTGERPYVCAQCPKAFKELGTLTKHQLTHQAVRSRPFKCSTEGCGKAFTTNGSLNVHLRTHTGQRPYKCANCGKAFTTSGSLNVHLRSHTGQRPYKCDNCGNTFTTSGQLTVHFRSHTGKRPYQCPLCPKAFAKSSHAKKHQRSVHPTAH